MEKIRLSRRRGRADSGPGKELRSSRLPGRALHPANHHNFHVLSTKQSSESPAQNKKNPCMFVPRPSHGDPPGRGHSETRRVPPWPPPGRRHDHSTKARRDPLEETAPSAEVRSPRERAEPPADPRPRIEEPRRRTGERSLRIEGTRPYFEEWRLRIEERRACTWSPRPAAEPLSAIVQPPCRRAKALASEAFRGQGRVVSCGANRTRTPHADRLPLDRESRSQGRRNGGRR
ncbi:hypothetical protein SAMN04489716_0851 [Actinoplanes derwentensis]|uniref:Uncharacterized protein n=1 Tax=Actinoplanes derwentensis TaxID=113562 RepID=A0A1H1SHY9_9ACTN|nr:hypothetical protein SAMN04489716_0851 [Actinoplanes derwentensis]